MSVASFGYIFSHSKHCVFALLMVSFAVQKLLSLVRSTSPTFFIFITPGGESKKDLAVIYVSVLSMFSFNNFWCPALHLGL